MKKKFIVLVLIFTLLLSIATVSFAKRGDDIPRVFSTGEVTDDEVITQIDDEVTEGVEETPVENEITEEEGTN